MRNNSTNTWLLSIILVILLANLYITYSANQYANRSYNRLERLRDELLNNGVSKDGYKYGDEF